RVMEVIEAIAKPTHDLIDRGIALRPDFDLHRARAASAAQQFSRPLHYRAFQAVDVDLDHARSGHDPAGYEIIDGGAVLELGTHRQEGMTIFVDAAYKLAVRAGCFPIVVVEAIDTRLACQ